MKKAKVLIAIATLSLALAGLTVAAATDAKPAARAVTGDNETVHITEVSFKKGSSEITKDSRDQLSKTISRANAHGKIDEIKVISWADDAYPAGKELPKGQRELADKRSKSLKEALKSMTHDVDVDTYNMAERPNAFESFFNTSDAKIKNSLEAAGMGTTDSTVKRQLDRSKAVVMVIMDDDND